MGLCDTVQRGDNAALHGTCALRDIPKRFEPCQKYSTMFFAPGADRILVPVAGAVSSSPWAREDWNQLQEFVRIVKKGDHGNTATEMTIESCFM